MKNWGKLLTGILVCVLIISMTPIYAEKTDTEIFINDTIGKTPRGYVPNEIILKLKEGANGKDIANIARFGEMKQLQHGLHKLKISNGKMDAVLEALKKNPAVEYAEPNYIAHAFLVPNDPYYSYQWNFHGVDEGGIDMEPAWDVATGNGVIVAVIDTGIRVGTDLANTKFVPGYDFVNDDTDPTDDNGHGTHVAGTIAQSTNNGEGVAGVAFDVYLMPIKVLDSTGSGTYDDIVSGIYYAADNGANIISMSLGGSSPSTALEDALAYAYNKGITIIAAAGNDGTNVISYPAAYDAYVIAVGATQYDKTLAPYSNYGTSLDIVAPGGNLNVDQNGDGYGDGILQQTFTLRGINVNWGYYFYQGTSMATPHVSGVAALIYSLGVTNPDDIRNILQSTAIDLGDPGWDEYYGWGLVNAYAAVQAALGTPVNQPPTCSLTASPTSGDAPLTVTFSMSASDPDGTIASWELDVDSDGVADYSGSGLPPATQNHTYNDAGNYTAKLTVWDDAGASAYDTVDITVTSPTPPPVSGSMYVWDISWTLSYRGRNADLYFTVTVKWDSDGDGVAEATDEVVSDATVYATLTHLDSGSTWSFSGVTDANGQVTFNLFKAPSGNYEAKVTDITHATYTYDATLDVDNPDYYTI